MAVRRHAKLRRHKTGYGGLLFCRHPEAHHPSLITHHPSLITFSLHSPTRRVIHLIKFLPRHFVLQIRFIETIDVTNKRPGFINFAFPRFPIVMDANPRPVIHFGKQRISSDTLATNSALIALENFSRLLPGFSHTFPRRLCATFELIDVRRSDMRRHNCDAQLGATFELQLCAVRHAVCALSGVLVQANRSSRTVGT